MSQSLSLSGIVYNENNEPLENAIIFIKYTKISAVSDKKGYYSLLLPASNSIVVECTYLGYEKYVNEISMKDSLNLDIVLKGDIYKLNEVEIVSNKFNLVTYAGEQTLKTQDFKQENLIQDVPFVLNMQTSVFNTSDAGNGVGYTSLRIRGVDQSRINVTINDVPLNDAESQNVYWVDVPDLVSSTNSIRIQKGVGSSTNGTGAYGGTIAMNTFGIDINPNITLNAGVGSYGTNKLSVKLNTGLMNNRYNVEARYSIVNSDGFVDRATTKLSSWYLQGAKIGSTSSLRFITFSGKERTYQSWNGVPQSVLFQDKQELIEHYHRNKGSLYHTKEDSINLFESNRTYNFYLYPNQVDDYNQSHYQLHYSKSIQKLRTKSALYYTKGRGFFEQYRHQDELQKYNITDLVIGGNKILKSNLARRRWLDNDFYGSLLKIEYDLNQSTIISAGGAYNKYIGDHFGNLVFIEGVEKIKPENYYFNTGNKSDFNTYLRYESKLSKLIFALDLQYRRVAYSIIGDDNDGQEHNIKNEYNFINPKAVVNYHISNNSLLSVSMGIANREPDRSDLLDNPNNNPKSESLLDIELGWMLKKIKQNLNLNLYFMRYKDQLVLTGGLNDVGNPIRVNIPESYRAGIEMSYDRELGRDFIWNFNTTFSENKIKQFNEILYDYTNGFEIKTIEHNRTNLAYSPALLINNEIKYMGIKHTQLSLQLKYAGKQYLDNTSNENRALDGFYYGNLRAQYSPKIKFAKSLNFLLHINNITNNLFNSNGISYSYIFNKEITENFYFPQAGTNFMLGIELKL